MFQSNTSRYLSNSEPENVHSKINSNIFAGGFKENVVITVKKLRTYSKLFQYM